MPIPSFKSEILEQISACLGDTDTGLTGTEIGRFLKECDIYDSLPEMTKRHRLFQALKQKQDSDHCANNICNFIQKAMSPVRHVKHRDYFESKRSELNSILAFEGLTFTEEGLIEKTERTAKTIRDAKSMADHLRSLLSERAVHQRVLSFCRAELFNDVLKGMWHCFF